MKGFDAVTFYLSVGTIAATGTVVMHAEQSEVRRGIGHLDLLGDDEFLQPRLHGGGQARLKIDQNLVGQAIGEQVAFHFALGIHERGVAAGVFGEAGDVVGHLAVEKLRAVRAQQAQSRAVGEVQHARSFSQRCKLIFHGGDCSTFLLTGQGCLAKVRRHA